MAERQCEEMGTIIGESNRILDSKLDRLSKLRISYPSPYCTKHLTHCDVNILWSGVTMDIISDFDRSIFKVNNLVLLKGVKSPYR